MTFDQWFQLRLDSLRRQNEWRKIDCLLTSKEYVRDAWEHNKVPDGYVIVPVEPTQEMLNAAYQGDVEYCRRNFGPGVHISQGAEDHWAAMLSAIPKETK